jgi:N-formylglutamate deformylase
VTDDEFLSAFEACTLSYPGEWDHRAHLRVADLHLDRFPLDEAIARVGRGIRRFNAAKGIPDLPDAGYHETLTQMWMRIVHGLRSAVGRESGFDAFLERHYYLGQKHLGRLFYSSERMMSARAKREYVPPDLTPFPGTVPPPADDAPGAPPP